MPDGSMHPIWRPQPALAAAWVGCMHTQPQRPSPHATSTYLLGRRHHLLAVSTSHTTMPVPNQEWA